MRPCRSMVTSATDRHAPSSARSAAITSALPPAEVTVAQTSSKGPWRRPTPTTNAPSRAKISMHDLPIPVPAPVIKAIFPSMRSMPRASSRSRLPDVITYNSLISKSKLYVTRLGVSVRESRVPGQEPSVPGHDPGPAAGDARGVETTVQPVPGRLRLGAERVPRAQVGDPPHRGQEGRAGGRVRAEETARHLARCLEQSVMRHHLGDQPVPERGGGIEELAGEAHPQRAPGPDDARQQDAHAPAGQHADPDMG